MLRKVLVTLALLAVVVIAAGIYLVHHLESRLARDSQEKLKKLEPQVITGSGKFTKSTFYIGEDLGEVAEILVGWPADREGAALTVVGNQGVHFLDRSGLLKKEIHFSKRIACPVEVTRVDASGEYGYLTRSQGWAFDAILFDEHGQERWSYSGGTLGGIDDSAGGDLDGKGNLQVVIGFNGGGGVVLVDGEGKKIWQKADANVWHVEILDTDDGGRKRILHSNAGGQLLVRDASGAILARYLPGHYVSDFALTKWGMEAQPHHILVPSQERSDGCCKPVAFVLDAEGKAVAHFDVPLGELMHDSRGTPVHFPKQSAFYALLQTNSPLERSSLLIYNTEGEIAYHEILEDACHGIAAVPGKAGDRLLVGCSGKILEYSPASNSTVAKGTTKP